MMPVGWNSPCSAPSKSVSSSRAVELIVLWPNVPLGRSSAPLHQSGGGGVATFFPKSDLPTLCVALAGGKAVGSLVSSALASWCRTPTHWVNWGRGSWEPVSSCFCAWSSFHQQVGPARGREMRSSWPHLPGIELLDRGEKCQQVPQDETIANG